METNKKATSSFGTEEQISNFYSDSEFTSNFLRTRKSPSIGYRNYNSALETAGKTAFSSSLLSTITTRAEAVAFIKSALTSSSNAALLSAELEATNSTYAKIIHYYSNMFLYRSVTSLVQADSSKTTSDIELKEAYDQALSIVEGLSIEVTYPDLIKEIILKGSVYFTVDKQTGAETLSTYLLPSDYCRTGSKTNFHTNVVEFNFKWFDKFASTFGKENSIFNYFPKEFKKGYDAYKANVDNASKPYWRMLDPRTTTSVLANEKGIPPLLSSLIGTTTAGIYEENELTKSTTSLEKILVNRLETYEGSPVFSLPQAKGFHKAMSKVTAGNSKLKTLTVFGPVELLDLQEDASNQDEILTRAYKNIFQTAGINSELFMGDSADSLKASLQMDQNMIWDYIKDITNFYTVVINKFYNLSPFEARLKILNISSFNESEKVAEYLSRAEYGIGVTEAIVAAGIPQKNIELKLRIESLLELSTKLKPLQSSHTTSSTDVKSSTTTSSSDDSSEINNTEVE